MDTSLQLRRTQAPDFTLPDRFGNPFHLYGHLPAAGTVVIFYRGHWCPYCRRYLEKLQGNWPRFAERGTQLIGISPDPPDASRALAEQLSIQFPLLSDVDGATIDRFGTRNGFAAVRSLLPHPAAFIIDAEGSVRFRSIDRNYKKRTTIRTIFEHLRELPGT